MLWTCSHMEGHTVWICPNRFTALTATNPSGGRFLGAMPVLKMERHKNDRLEGSELLRQDGQTGVGTEPGCYGDFGMNDQMNAAGPRTALATYWQNSRSSLHKCLNVRHLTARRRSSCLRTMISDFFLTIWAFKQIMPIKKIKCNI